MAIGTSSGAFYPDEFSFVSDLDGDMLRNPLEIQKSEKIENNIQSPNEMMANKQIQADVNNIFDDQGNMVDYNWNNENPSESKDYDYDAWKKANPDKEMKPGEHYPDTYKLPNHMTFSDESIYSGNNGDQGGHWGKDENDKWTFTPGPSNFQHHTIDEMQKYFKEIEPDSTLILPQKKPSIPDFTNDRPHDWVERAAMAIGKALTLPGDVYAGKVDPLSKEGIERTADLAMTLTGSPRSGTLGSGVTLPEKVDSAALQYKGEIFKGKNHGYALGDIMDKHGDVDMKSVRDGFTTTHGRFISREEAMDIARAQQQINPETLKDLPKDSSMLLSEDLN